MVQRRITKTIRSFCLGFSAALLFPVVARTAFLDPGYGVRPQGMGGAFTAISDDNNAFLYNPAGAVQAAETQVSFMHAKLFLGLEDVDLSLNSAFALHSLSKTDFPLNVLGMAWTNFRAPVYQEDTVYFLGAASLRRFIPLSDSSLAFGFNLKMMRTQYELDSRAAADDLFSAGSGRSVFSLDLGLWTRPDPERMPGLRFGLSGRNLNRPDVGLMTTDTVSREVSAGLAYDFSRVTVAVDAMNRDSETFLRAGAETWLLQKRVGLRAGGGEEDVSMGFSYVFGIGPSSRVVVDYAFTIPTAVDDAGGSHRMALGMKF